MLLDYGYVRCSFTISLHLRSCVYATHCTLFRYRFGRSTRIRCVGFARVTHPLTHLLIYFAISFTIHTLPHVYRTYRARTSPLHHAPHALLRFWSAGSHLCLGLRCRFYTPHTPLRLPPAFTTRYIHLRRWTVIYEPRVTDPGSSDCLTALLRGDSRLRCRLLFVVTTAHTDFRLPLPVHDIHTRFTTARYTTHPLISHATTHLHAFHLLRGRLHTCRFPYHTPLTADLSVLLLDTDYTRSFFTFVAFPHLDSGYGLPVPRSWLSVHLRFVRYVVICYAFVIVIHCLPRCYGISLICSVCSLGIFIYYLLHVTRALRSYTLRFSRCC